MKVTEKIVEDVEVVADASDSANENNVTFERVTGVFGWKSDFQCSNGKYIKFLGFDVPRSQRYMVDDCLFECAKQAKNYCQGLPLNWGRKKLIIPTI